MSDKTINLDDLDDLSQFDVQEIANRKLWEEHGAASVRSFYQLRSKGYSDKQISRIIDAMDFTLAEATASKKPEQLGNRSRKRGN